MARDKVLLPSPGVRFAPDFLGRLRRLVARLASQRERREGEGRARLFGVGSEFVGYRPYRSGEDLRALDWNLLARLGRPFVRVAAREASEDWSVVLDSSASMGVGRPGKLQLGAELALAVAALGLARRATVELRLSGAGLRGVLRRRADLGAWLRALEGARAEGRAGLGAAVRELARERGAGRVFLIGDLLDLEPAAALALARPSRELFLAQILAREELVPPRGGSVRWVDAEEGAWREVAVDAPAANRYERRLADGIERWRRAALHARAAHGCWTSDAEFESVARALCAGAQ